VVAARGDVGAFVVAAGSWPEAVRRPSATPAASVAIRATTTAVLPMAWCSFRDGAGVFGGAFIVRPPRRFVVGGRRRSFRRLTSPPAAARILVDAPSPER
jgi:hypothetical protein